MYPPEIFSLPKKIMSVPEIKFKKTEKEISSDIIAAEIKKYLILKFFSSIKSAVYFAQLLFESYVFEKEKPE